ncbi:MAG: hypothetical protein HFJ52_08810 [Clostridia bacterium]|nr:hypothetical protein [Clostridia bacterium]
MLYAIVNTFLGTNLTGDERACLINNKCDASYGEIHFTDNNGIEHILIRGKHKYDNTQNFISLDGKMVKQEALGDFYRDKKLFLLILNPMYFLGKKPTEQKELVDKYLNAICPNNLMEIAYNKLSKNEQKLLEGMPKDIQTYIADINSDIKRIEGINTSLQGKIDYAQNIANEELPERKVFEKDEELTLARQELSFLTSNQSIIDKENQKKLVSKLSDELLSKENELLAIINVMEETKKQYYAIKNSDTAHCPTCNHLLEQNKGLALLNMKKIATDKYDRSVELTLQVDKLKNSLMVEKAKFYAMDANVNANNTEKIRIVETNIKNLEAQKGEVDKFNNEIDVKLKNINAAQKDISNFNKGKSDNSKLIETLKKTKKVAQKLYISYIEQKMLLAKKYLKNVKIKFYSVLKETGELKDDFIITYQNKPLCDLSRSETIATALEFANMFNKISKSNLPIFIDDYESCADYDFINEYAKGNQILISTVQKKVPLTIANYNDNSESLVIKQKIKGYKTIKHLIKHHSTNLAKVA